MLAGSAYEASSSPRVALFVGIHNDWDAVTYHVFVKRKTKMQ